MQQHLTGLGDVLKLRVAASSNRLFKGTSTRYAACRPLTPALGSTMTEIVLGDEYDEALFERLVAEVSALGGSITDKEWTLGGSQEKTVFEISLPDGNIEAVTETYVGLSLRGTPSLVERLARRVMPNPLLQRTAAPPAER